MKKFIKYLLIFATLLCLSGCMKMNATFKILSDGNYNFYMDLLVSEESLKTVNIDIDTVIEMITDELSISQNSIQEYSKTIEDKNYLGYKIQYTHKSAESLDNIHISFNDSNDEITFRIDSPSIGNELINLDALGSGKDALQVLKNNGIDIIVSVEMPGKVIYASKGTVNGDIVTIDLLEEELSNVVITSEIDHHILGIFLVIAIPSLLMFIHHETKLIKERY